MSAHWLRQHEIAMKHRDERVRRDVDIAKLKDAVIEAARRLTPWLKLDEDILDTIGNPAYARQIRGLISTVNALNEVEAE